MAFRLCRRVLLLALAVALMAPALASAQISPPAAAEARDQGFDARDALGSDVSLDQSGAGEGLFRVELANGRALTTHGPDKTAAAGEHGTRIGPGDPERDPACAADDTQHVLYGVPADQASRYPEVVPEIQAIMRRMNAVLNSESLESGGGEVDYRMLCGASGEIKVDTFTAPAGDDSFDAVVSAAQAAGFNQAATKYMIFYESDAPGYCGVGSIHEDDRLSADNRNNTSRSYALVHDGCWDGDTPMHENGHNMGAVQPEAPNSTGDGLHCNQERDVMCYSPDGGDRNQGGTVLDCDDHKHFDCGHDDYFDTAPEAGEYLSTHWNVGSPLNRFLTFAGTASNGPPAADFGVSCAELACAFTDTSSDADGTIASRTWDFGDGATSSAAAPSHSFARPGTYGVSLTVTDDLGEVSTREREVTVATINDAPLPAADAATTEKGVARDLFVLANDRDPDSDPLRVTAVSAPAHGSASVASGGQSVRYAPTAGWVGRDSLTYTVSDERGGQATATVTITVRDTIAPKVTRVTPVSGTRSVWRGANLSARFSEPMRAATVNPTTVKLLRKGTRTPARAAVRYSSATRTAVLDPAATLARGATYTATVRRGARDLSANYLASETSWSFTVRR